MRSIHHPRRAVAIVLDCTTDNETVERLRAFGAGWRFGIDTWRDTQLPFLILVAPNEDRIRRGAPLVLAAEDVAQAAAIACAHLDDVQCAWWFACSTETRRAVEPVLLADVTVGGHA
jgi:hypothetical protein